MTTGTSGNGPNGGGAAGGARGPGSCAWGCLRLDLERFFPIPLKGYPASDDVNAAGDEKRA